MALGKEQKNNTLRDLADLISANKQEIIRQNQKDIAQATDIDDTLLDRLKVDEKKVDGMVAAVEEVMHLEDPEGKILSHYKHPNGMIVENRVVPFGRILIIYESRPDVTIEAAVSAFKAGNKILLKGGKEALNSNLILTDLWKQALRKNNVSEDFVTYLSINREETQKMLRENTHHLDLIIPRGGEGLINYIKQNASAPVIVSGRGNNFIYVHQDADFDMAIELILNGKSRLSVCNAIDKVLFHKDIERLEEKMESLLDKLSGMGMEVFGDGRFFASFEKVNPMPVKEMWDEEFLAAKLLFGTVFNLEEAIQQINRHSGGHSAVIVCRDKGAANTFQEEVDSAAVYHNASSRFTDGGQFGFGAEMAISTQKLHFRGPVGLAQLVTNKWFINGDGQVR